MHDLRDLDHALGVLAHARSDFEPARERLELAAKQVVVAAACANVDGFGLSGQTLSVTSSPEALAELHGVASLTPDALDDVFRYHPPTADQARRYEALRASARDLARLILDLTPSCSDQYVAIRKVREAVMTANAAIALQPTEGRA